MRFDAWNYRPDSGWTTGFDLVGYHLEATDGRLGKISEVAHAQDASYLVVDIGPWLFGHRVLLPAGLVTNIDHTDRRIYVDRTKDQVRSAPDFDPDMSGEETYREKVDGYYRGTYPGQ
jgi:hypothetical protein